MLNIFTNEKPSLVELSRVAFAYASVAIAIAVFLPTMVQGQVEFQRLNSVNLGNANILNPIAAMDLNGDYLDDIVTIEGLGDNIRYHIYYQLDNGQFQSVIYPFSKYRTKKE